MANEMFLERSNEAAPADAPDQSFISDTEALELFKEAKKQAFDSRWTWERIWMRNIHYVNGRQWVEYIRRTNEWRDVRLAQWFPKPVTNKMSEGLQALRAMFAAVNIGVNVRPIGADPKNVAVASVADDMHPLLHEEHMMDDVLDEADFWFVVTGNVFLHTYLERDVKHGVDVIPFEQCAECKEVYSPEMIQDAGNVCPSCGAMEFMPAVSPETGAPIEKQIPRGKGVTCALSPFELAFPNSYARFSDVPFVIRLRWRTKSYYENNPVLAPQMKGFKYSKAPSEQALQLFRSLPYQSDTSVSPFLGGGGQDQEEGAAEYEMWMRPCDKYPQGLVLRVVGDANPIVLHQEEDEAIPGPLPYVDAAGKPVFTFSHAAFEQRGGKVYGASPFDGVIQKQNQLNQLDSFALMIVNRTANPLWLVPKGAEIEKFTGQPGLVVKWNPLTVGGNAKPERVDGVGPGAWLFQMREQFLHDIEEGLGTYDVLKGSKPSGVDSFSGLQLMVERGQSRFASAFKSRGSLYKDWYKFALELEREFGPEERTRNVLSPARGWSAQQFKNAQLQGSFEVIVEDGSMTPKTSLGTRAAVEHLSTLNVLDPNDPDQKIKILQLFGQSNLIPKLDVDLQSALRKQEAFEVWAKSPEQQQASMLAAQQDVAQYQQQLAMVPDAGPAQIDPATGQDMAPQPQLPPPPSLNARTPLAWKPWFNPAIHKQEFLKWANGDKIVQLLAENPALEQLLTAHLQDIDNALMQLAMQQAAGQAAGSAQVNVGRKVGGAADGAGQAMKNSNRESGGQQNSDGGHAKPQS